MRRIFTFIVIAALQAYSGNLYAMENPPPGSMQESSGTAALGPDTTGVVTNSTAEQTHKNACSSNYVSCGMAILAAVQVGLYIYDMTQHESNRDVATCTGTECYRNPDPTRPSDDYRPNNPNDPNSGGPDAPNPNDPNSGGPNLQVLDREMEKMLNDSKETIKALEAKGFKYDAKDNSISGPRGKVAAASMGSAAGMKSAGFSDKEIAAAMKTNAIAMKKADEKLKALSALLDQETGGGGGSSRSVGSDSSSDKSFNPLLFRPGTKRANEKPTVAGLSKQYGNDQIGVASDNLFKMIERRYSAQRQRGFFMEQDMPSSSPVRFNSAE